MYYLVQKVLARNFFSTDKVSYFRVDSKEKLDDVIRKAPSRHAFSGANVFTYPVDFSDIPEGSTILEL